MSVLFRAADIERAACRASPRVLCLSEEGSEGGGMAGVMMDARNDCLVLVAPSTRTADTLTRESKFSLIYE